MSLWNNDIDQNIVYHLSHPSNSPLFDIRAKYRQDSKLNAALISLFRFLNRVPLSSQLRAQINQEFIVEFYQCEYAFRREYDNIEDSSDQHLLQQSVNFIKEHKSSSIQKSIQNPNTAFGIDDTQLFNFLLLDSAAVWPELCFENTLESLDMLCLSWSLKCNDIFDSSLQLLINHWVK